MKKDKLLFQIKKLQFSYIKEIVINIKYLEIYNNKIYMLSGPNGSGKTTLLKLLNGLLKVNSDNILFQGISIQNKNYNIIRKKSIFVHQDPFLFSGTVYDNIVFCLKIRKKKNINKKVDEVLDIVGLTKYKKRNCNNLSTGEIKRVSIARAIAVEPEVLLLDEPTSGVDKENKEKLEKILINLSKNSSIIFSTHDVIFGEKVCDEIVCLEYGKVKKKIENNINFRFKK